MRLAATYRGARRNALRALGRLGEWSSMKLFVIKHRVFRWVTEVNPETKVPETKRTWVDRHTVIHETLRVPLPQGA